VATLGLAALVATAGPLSPTLGPLASGDSVAGESKLCSGGGTCADFVQVDWIVYNDAGTYVYYYQLENTTGSSTVIDFLTINSQNWLSAGFLSDIDMDSDFAGVNAAAVDGHNSGKYLNLGGVPSETEPSLAGNISDPDSATVTPTSADWEFVIGGGPPDVVRKNEQSTVLFATSLFHPKYGHAFASDTIPPSPWVTTNTGSTLLPVPVPEPGFYGLVGIGLSAIWLGVTRRRRRCA
jgi:hypothetical protein